MESDNLIIYLAQSYCFQYLEIWIILFNFEDKIFDGRVQSRYSVWVFFGISNLWHKIENENEYEGIRVHQYNLGKTVTSLYVLNDTFQRSRNEITELINQLFVIAEDVRRKIWGNSNESTHAVFQTTKTLLIDNGPWRPKVDIS